MSGTAPSGPATWDCRDVPVTTSVTGAKIGDFSWDLIRQRTKNGTKWWFNGDQLWLLRINGVFFNGVFNGETWSNGKFKKQKYVGFPLDFMRIFNGDMNGIKSGLSYICLGYNCYVIWIAANQIKSQRGWTWTPQSIEFTHGSDVSFNLLYGPNVGLFVGLEIKPSLTLIISLSKFLGDHTQPLPYLLFIVDTGLKGCSLSSTWYHPSFHVNLWNVPWIRWLKLQQKLRCFLQDWRTPKYYTLDSLSIELG